MHRRAMRRRALAANVRASGLRNGNRRRLAQAEKRGISDSFKKYSCVRDNARTSRRAFARCAAAPARATFMRRPSARKPAFSRVFVAPQRFCRASASCSDRFARDRDDAVFARSASVHLIHFCLENRPLTRFSREKFLHARSRGKFGSCMRC